MFGSDVIEVGIGLTLVLLLVSLLCSAVREMIESLLKSRAMDLERGIRELLDDPGGLTTAKAFFDHANIFSLFAASYDPNRLKRGLGNDTSMRMPWPVRRTLPTYIPSAQFATAVMDIVARGSGSWLYPVSNEPLTLDLLRERATKLPNGRLQRAVLTAVDQAGGDLAQARKNLEAWFDGTMDRVSGWYKRRTQFWLIGIGFVAAMLMNIDIIAIGSRITEDRTLRQALVSQAETVNAQGLEAMQKRSIEQVRADLEAMQLPMGWVATDAPVRIRGWQADGLVWLTPGPQGCRLALERAQALADAAYAEGKRPSALLTSRERRCTTADPVHASSWPGIVLGWFITALAVSFGAPFWFDVLNKFMVIRSTVKPAEKSPPEGSEDRRAAAPPHPAAPAPVIPGVVGPPPTPAPARARKAAGATPAVPPAPAPGAALAGHEAEGWKPGFTNPHGEVDV
ncbi:hypothetical protein [Phenylobacterium sp.]|jgi:hypothetical protein|uniref:hypothetical protein n=1 Tax=Phenylobacterium sp. TaxID=1871053 RepID=UPI002F921B08